MDVVGIIIGLILGAIVYFIAALFLPYIEWFPPPDAPPPDDRPPE
jgi:hypothetical protein